MSFVIFGDLFTFPEGNAATNRVYNYARGFIENGTDAYVICFRHSYSQNKEGSVNDIKYYIPFTPHKRSDSLILRSWYRVSKYLNAVKIIIEIGKKDKIIAINCYSRIFGTRLFAYFLAKITNSKLVLESSEHPYQYYKTNSLFSRIRANVELKIALKLSDGVLCISRYLVDFYKGIGVNPQKLFLVPSTVDTARFIKKETSPLNFQYVLYCGGLSILKDGVNILIKSFASISGLHSNIFLVLIGKAESANEEKVLKELVKKLHIESKVYFLGQIPRNEIPKYLSNSAILALARPKSLVADAGFPSKLTEYLATGVPVIVTSVGEIPDYLTDNENAFLSKPDSAAAFADKMSYVLENYTQALEVAKHGKDLTETVFNYNYQSKRVLELISSIS